MAITKSRPTVFSSASECSAVEGSVVENKPAGNGSGRISIAKIRYQETLQRNSHCGELLPSKDF
jgi:hypothetical protein